MPRVYNIIYMERTLGYTNSKHYSYTVFVLIIATRPTPEVPPKSENDGLATTYTDTNKQYIRNISSEAEEQQSTDIHTITNQMETPGTETLSSIEYIKQQLSNVLNQLSLLPGAVIP